MAFGEEAHRVASELDLPEALAEGLELHERLRDRSIAKLASRFETTDLRGESVVGGPPRLDQFGAGVESRYEALEGDPEQRGVFADEGSEDGDGGLDQVVGGVGGLVLGILRPSSRMR